MISSSFFFRRIQAHSIIARGLAIFGAAAILPVSASAAITTGSKVTFSATADGSPAPAFQWKKNGADLPGATGATFVIAAASLADMGTYRVTATNVAGSADSIEDVLVVEAAPSPTIVAPAFTVQPVGTPVVAGGTATFAVAASGTPTPTYQWEKNGFVLTGATNATLTINNVTTDDAGTYLAIATNTGGSVTSNPAVLSVTIPPPQPPQNIAPSFTTQPAPSQGVTAGGTAVITIVATGTPTPALQWKKGGIAISGATNATLTLANTTTNDSGIYTVVAYNVAGSVTSNPSVLSVTTLPSFTTQPTPSQTANAGSSVTFTVAATAIPAPTYQWKKNGTAISGATSATLKLTSVTANSSGTYTAVATNVSGSTTSNAAVLTVNVTPTISTQPASSQTVKAGATVTLTVTATGTPIPTYQWKKNAIAISGATNATLTLSSVTSNDSATYVVVATNVLGSTTSSNAVVVIGTSPVITTQPKSQIVATKSNVTFSVAATGIPTPTYQWKKNGVKLNGATTSTLGLRGVRTADEGSYTVEATNSLGVVVSSPATLIVSDSNGLKVADSDETFVATNIDPADTNTSRIVNLSVRSRAGSGNNGLIVGFVIGGSASKPMLLRGVGPALSDFGVTDALLDPTLALYSGAAMTASNDNWAKDADAFQIVATSARLGAFSLAESSADSALMANLETGAYTLQVNGKDSATGVALVEVYDAAATNAASLVNLSVRTQVGTGDDAPNVGFVVSGTTAKRVLIRAVGPTLGAFGVSDVLADPQLEIFKEGVRLGGNDNWGGDAELTATFARVGAFGLAQANSKDAVLLVTLQPGAYTVVASGVNSGTGVALVEVYDVP